MNALAKCLKKFGSTRSSDEFTKQIMVLYESTDDPGAKKRKIRALLGEQQATLDTFCQQIKSIFYSELSDVISAEIEARREARCEAKRAKEEAERAEVEARREARREGAEAKRIKAETISAEAKMRREVKHEEARKKDAIRRLKHENKLLTVQEDHQIERLRGQLPDEAATCVIQSLIQARRVRLIQLEKLMYGSSVIEEELQKTEAEQIRHILVEGGQDEGTTEQTQS
jgi:hypothetical protein